ncbi:hypothetical protein DRO33_01220, partial [Candidatus Bathyarchaeota archaeon]
MPRIEKKWFNISWAVSVITAAVIIFLSLTKYAPLEPALHQYLNIALMVGIAAPMVLDTLDRRWRGAINRELPRFLESIAHAQLTGLPLLRAFKEAGEGVSGPLREEVRLMMAKVSWGMSFEDALRS